MELTGHTHTHSHGGASQWVTDRVSVFAANGLKCVVVRDIRDLLFVRSLVTCATALPVICPAPVGCTLQRFRPCGALIGFGFFLKPKTFCDQFDYRSNRYIAIFLWLIHSSWTVVVQCQKKINILSLYDQHYNVFQTNRFNSKTRLCMLMITFSWKHPWCFVLFQKPPFSWSVSDTSDNQLRNFTWDIVEVNWHWCVWVF